MGIINVQQPSVCDGVTSDGSFIIRNTNYSGPLLFKIQGGAYFEVEDVNNSFYFASGAGNTNPANPYSAAIMEGSLAGGHHVYSECKK